VTAGNPLRLEQLARVASLAAVGIAYVDDQRRYRMANPVYLAWLGMVWSEIEGQPLGEVPGGAAYDALKTALTR
jgi:hypothetical protein